MDFEFEDGLKMVRALTRSVMSIVENLTDNNSSLNSYTTSSSSGCSSNLSASLYDESMTSTDESLTSTDTSSRSLLSSSVCRRPKWKQADPCEGENNRPFLNHREKIKQKNSMEYNCSGSSGTCLSAYKSSTNVMETPEIGGKINFTIDLPAKSGFSLLNLSTKRQLMTHTFPPNVAKNHTHEPTARISPIFSGLLKYKSMSINRKIDSHNNLSDEAFDLSKHTGNIQEEFENDMKFLEKAQNKTSTPEDDISIPRLHDLECQSRREPDISDYLSRDAENPNFRFQTDSLSRFSQSSSPRRLFFRSEEEEAVYYLVTKYLNKN